MKEFKNFLSEASLSRLWKHGQEHDTGAMTAYRNAPNCGDGEPYSKKENDARNKSLLAKLKSLNYGVIAISGKYPEGGKVKTERSFFVVDNADKGNLEKDLKRLGKQFEQDSVLFVPKGTGGYLVGTNNCKNNDLGMNGKLEFNKVKFGQEGEYYSSLIRGRPFTNEDVQYEFKEVIFGSGYASIVNGKVAKQDWQELVNG